MQEALRRKSYGSMALVCLVDKGMEMESRFSTPTSTFSISHSLAQNTVSPEADLPLTLGDKRTKKGPQLKPNPFSHHPCHYPGVLHACV